MEKVTLIIFSALLFTGQFAFSQTKFGFSAGLNLNNINQDLGSSPDKIATKPSAGYSLGMVLKFRSSKKFGIISGLQFKTIGAALDLEDDLAAGESIDGFSRLKLSYLSVPLNFTYKINKIELIVGAYAAFGITGKNKFDYTMKDASGEVTIKGDLPVRFGSIAGANADYIGMNIFDYGVNIGVGYDLINALAINAVYSLGLANTHPGLDGGNPELDYKLYNRVFSLSVHYILGTKK